MLKEAVTLREATCRILLTALAHLDPKLTQEQLFLWKLPASNVV